MWLWDWIGFDLLKRIETSGIVPLEGLHIAGPNAAHGVFYEPIPVRYFDAAVRALRIDLSQFDFVDLGSGMGRTLVLAAKYPFRKILGIEFSQLLHEKAERNIAARFGNSKVPVIPQSILCDVVDFPFVARDCVIFMFNPFDEFVLSRVLVKLQGIAQQCRIVIVYCEAKHHRRIVDSEFLRWEYDVQLPTSFTRWKGWISSIRIYSNFM